MAYNLQKDGRDLIWLELELVINAPDEEKLFMTPLGKGVLIRQQIALYADESPEVNAQIIANVSTDLIKRAVVVRSRVLELDENGQEVI
jgi:hypothetical protein